MLHATHDVATEGALGIEGRLRCQHLTRLQVEQLGDEGGGPQIHGHAAARARREVEAGVVDQDGSTKLLDLQRRGRNCATAARETPARLALFVRQERALLVADGQRPLDQADAAAPATAVATAGELDPVGVEDIAQGRAALHLDTAAQGSQLDPDDVVHGGSDDAISRTCEQVSAGDARLGR
jgi:hypothetical protein